MSFLASFDQAYHEIIMLFVGAGLFIRCASLIWITYINQKRKKSYTLLIISLCITILFSPIIGVPFTLITHKQGGKKSPTKKIEKKQAKQKRKTDDTTTTNKTRETTKKQVTEKQNIKISHHKNDVKIFHDSKHKTEKKRKNDT